MLHVMTTPAEDFDCIAVQLRSHVVVVVADRILSESGAYAINAALARLEGDRHES